MSTPETKTFEGVQYQLVRTNNNIVGICKEPKILHIGDIKRETSFIRDMENAITYAQQILAVRA
jgi:hypothetical protein